MCVCVWNVKCNVHINLHFDCLPKQSIHPTLTEPSHLSVKNKPPTQSKHIFPTSYCQAVLEKLNLSFFASSSTKSDSPETFSEVSEELGVNKKHGSKIRFCPEAAP